MNFSTSFFPLDLPLPVNLPDPLEAAIRAPTRSHHHAKEAIHSRTGLFDRADKKGGHGSANWGSPSDEIAESIALAHSDDTRSHSAADVGAHKLVVSPPVSPSVADTADPIIQESETK
ncbi:uncharacterized protein JCM10292_006184 [Rhodotorula paludigena]|uniref:uncharacterized protein n=1 Tax=Rhodotorula paludigena TaxID=86838 RepID=UPI00317C9D9D